MDNYINFVKKSNNHIKDIHCDVMSGLFYVY